MATNAIIWASVLFFPNYIYEGFFLIKAVSDKFSLGLLGVPLFFTAFAVYALFRLKYDDIEEQSLKSDLMASYALQEKSSKRWTIWVISIAAGAINVGLMILADLYLNNAL